MEADLLAEVIGERHVAREGVTERAVELEHFEQVVALDDVQVAVGECAHGGGRLRESAVPPEVVAKHVAAT